MQISLFINSCRRPMISKISFFSIMVLMLAMVKGEEKEFVTCFEHLGCINFTQEWFHPSYRSVNLQPLDRHIINTQFLLLSSTPKDDVILYDPITANPQTVKITKYNTKYNLIMLIHDFTSNGFCGWIKHIAIALLSKEQYNVISINWQGGAEPPFLQAISNARVVAQETHFLLKMLEKNFSLLMGQVHIIGHGLGAHIAGYIGKSIPHIGRITGLDPTGPKFEGMPMVCKLCVSDAFYVEVLHTDGQGSLRQGTLEPMGSVDFYFNNGSYQPGCEYSDLDISITSLKRNDLKLGQTLPDCSHKRAYKYYIEAVKDQGCQFIGFQFDKIEDFTKIGCVDCSRGILNCAAVGLDVNVPYYAKQTNVKLMLEARDCLPYCMNTYQVTISFMNCTEAEPVSIGYFDMMMRDENSKLEANSTFNKDNSVPIELGKSISFIIFSGAYGMDRIREVELKWHYTTKFCFHCRNGTCVHDFRITHVKSSDSMVNETYTNHFCAKYQNYTLLKDEDEYNKDFVKC